MININYQTYGSSGLNVRLRLYQNGETKFVNVNKLLIGNLMKKHWNPKKRCLYPSAPYSEENNMALFKLKKKYEQAAEDWTGTLQGFIVHMDGGKTEPETDKPKTVRFVVDKIVEKMKAESVNPDGTLSEGYTAYDKMMKRLDEFCRKCNMNIDDLTLADMTPVFINKFLAYVVNKGTGRCLYVSQTLHAVLNKATKYGWYDIKKVEDCNWMKKLGKSARKYETLTEDQCKKFIELPLSELPKSQLVRLYRDFCVFILYSCQSTCDALSLQYKDIQNINGHDYLVFKRRKIAAKQSADCIVPINSVMADIINRYRGRSKDGYIFPVRNRKRIEDSQTNNADIKHFISRVNMWLKKLSPILGCPFSLHTYVFRHTGITHYISKGVSHVYVANLAGTSVDNIEKIYYNNQADVTNRNLVLNAVNF